MDRRYFWLLTLLSLPAYFGLLYVTPRTEWEWLLGLFGILFLLYAIQLHVLRLSSSKRIDKTAASLPIRDLLIAGVLVRIFAYAALPELTDDYFRFIWDGRLWHQGINPFAALPESYMQDSKQAEAMGLTQELFEGLNSPRFYTIYPPVLQAIFWLATAIFPKSIYGSVLVMKAFGLLAELASLYLLDRLLKRFQLPRHYLALYALNPLVVVELSGSLHFEALMIAFVLGSIYLLSSSQPQAWWQSALLFGLAVATKLLPLMFLPLMIRRLGWVKAIGYGAIAMGLTALMFLPIFDLETLTNLSQSIDLYFHRFEFNASLYYVIRWLGFEFYGRNVIKSVGTWLALAAMLSILIYVWLERKPSFHNLSNGMLWTSALYLLCATVVHPWYGTPLIAWATLGKYRWPILWSALLPLSYFTYRSLDYTEDLGLVALAYIPSILFLVYEVWKKGSSKAQTA